MSSTTFNSRINVANSMYTSSRSDLSVRGKNSSSSSGKESYTMRELACNLRDAVVNISTFNISTFNISGDIIEEQKLNIKNGNGFFIKGHYIICPSYLILNQNNTRVDKILVDVSNVNGSGESYAYEADIVGTDGAANIGILRIALANSQNNWNKSNPPIRICHPILQWGKSRSSCPGDTILLIGNTVAPNSIENLLLPGAENAVAIGNISDNRYVFPDGQVPGELLLLSNIIPQGSQCGLPVITIDGTVIGMILYINSTLNTNIALSEFFMRRPVKALIRSYQDGFVPEHYKGFIEHIIHPLGNYNKFNKAWLGIGGILMSQEDYISDIILQATNIFRVPKYQEEVSGSKDIVGYRILTIHSELLKEIFSYGDIITHINNCPLGDRKGQISPSLVMWRVRPGDMIKIIYKKQSERFENKHEVDICTNSYDELLDFPFYSCDIQSNKILPILI